MNTELEPDVQVEPIEVQKRNHLLVHVDGVGVGIASAATPFLPVFLTRLGRLLYRSAY